MQDLLLNSHFRFLTSAYGFQGPYEYKPGRSAGFYYVKGDIVVNFEYDGTYIAMIMKTKQVFNDLETGKLNLLDLHRNDYNFHEISKLDYRNRLWKSVSEESNPERYYWYYAKLIKKNQEILEGDFHKFSFRYFLLKWLKIVK
jgi:hypothetical protein